MPRGRPAGSKNKPKAAPIVVNDAPPSAQPISFLEDLQMGFNQNDDDVNTQHVLESIREAVDDDDFHNEEFDQFDDPHDVPQYDAPAPRYDHLEAVCMDDDDEFDTIFAKKPTEQTAILGKDKRELLTRIKEYKLLFPKELCKFKLAKNPTVEQCEEALQEMDVIVSCSSIEAFAGDAILNGLQIVEAQTARTDNWDLTGLADILKNNPSYNQLIKRLLIKYRVIGQIPVELQLLMVVGTTATVVRDVNRKKKGLNNFLDQRV